MAKATIRAGICGFTTIIDAVCDEDEQVSVAVETDCPNYRTLNGQTFVVDAFEDVLMAKVGQGVIYDTFRPTCPHAACPVPCGTTKAVEVAAGIALPRDVSITVEK